MIKSDLSRQLLDQVSKPYHVLCRAAPVMLLFLPIILLRISFKLYLLFQNYSQLLPIIPTFNLKQLLIKYTT